MKRSSLVNSIFVLLVATGCSSKSGDGGANLDETGGFGTVGSGGAASSSGGSDVQIIGTGGTTNPAQTPLTDEESCTGLVLEPESVQAEQEITTTIQKQIPAPVALYVVLDNSMSMNSTGVDSNQTKWEEAVSALTSFVNDPASAGLDVAIQYFHPVGVGAAPDECAGDAHATPAVEMGTLPEQAAAIVGSLETTRTSQSTPTLGALAGGTRYCAAFQTAHPEERCVVVLVTDGQPNACGLSAACDTGAAGAGGNQGQVPGGAGQDCVDPNSESVLAPIAAQGLASGVLTFTIGMAGVSADGFMLLDALAVAGGSDCTPGVAGAEACDVSSSGAAGFLAALNAIRESVTVEETVTETVTTTEFVTVPCEWTIPAPPSGQTLDPTLVNVNLIDGGEMPMPYVQSVADCPLAAGPAWYYDDPSAPTRILVCPATCDLLSARTTASVNVLFGCKRIEKVE